MLCCHCSLLRQTFKNKFIRQTVNNTISASLDQYLDLFDISVLNCGDLINFFFFSWKWHQTAAFHFIFYAFKKRSSWLVFENLVIKNCFIFKIWTNWPWDSLIPAIQLAAVHNQKPNGAKKEHKFASGTLFHLFQVNLRNNWAFKSFKLNIWMTSIISTLFFMAIM